MKTNQDPKISGRMKGNMPKVLNLACIDLISNGNSNVPQTSTTVRFLYRCYAIYGVDVVLCLVTYRLHSVCKIFPDLVCRIPLNKRETFSELIYLCGQTPFANGLIRYHFPQNQGTFC